MNNQAPKTVLCIHDLSALGRCSISVIAPVLSAMGHQAVALPTALLSTHTGGLGRPAVQDCSAFGKEAICHYRSLEIQFDCIYSGYLAGAENQQLVLDAFEAWPDALKIVDPVMGDHGRLYQGMEGMLDGMHRLCEKADLVLPNLTEACLLTGREYPEGELTEEEIDALCGDVASICGNQAVVTGIREGRNLLSAGGGKNRFTVKRVALEPSYPGTGDLFAAVLTGALLRGNAISAATDAAAGFVFDAIRNTSPKAQVSLGVWFEPLLGRIAPREV